MSFTTRRSFGDTRSLGRYARPIMQLVNAVADGDKETGIVLADDIAMDLRVDLILGNQKPVKSKRS